MKRYSAPIILIMAAAAGWWLLTRDDESPASEVNDLVRTYCIDCHNEVDLAGSLNLDGRPPADPGLHPEIYEQVVRKLDTGMMPPAGEPRPARESLEALSTHLKTELDQAATTAPRSVRTGLRRLNRSEYENAIRDLLHFDIDAADYLPIDDSSEGFDNMAAALGVSPTLIESYVTAAMKISRQAIGDSTTPRTQITYAVPEDLSQDRHLPGMPLGTRGGLRIEHQFPLDAEYEISIGQAGFRGSGGSVDITLDGIPLQSTGRSGLVVPVTAGPHVLTVAMTDSRRSDGVDDIYSAPQSAGGIRSIEIDGPLESTGISETPSRERILICTPAADSEARTCATRIVAALAGRAFRRPAADQHLAALMSFFDTAYVEGGFEAGIQQALARILVDPRFLYRFETEPELPAGTVFEVDDYALASRLSFFLWSSIPDDTLLDAASRGELRTDEQIEAQVRRMLRDPKRQALTENFASQWLFLRELDSVTPDSDRFDENLREAMKQETQLLFASILGEEESIVRLIDANYSFVNDRLAEHYGLEALRGSHFRRVDLPPDLQRRGILGHGSILTLTSVTNRTSPVIRGSWILENLLGSHAPVPPPDVETTLEGDDGASIASTVRERLEAHRANPTCASCHAIMDPVGLSLENFDLIGAWRDDESGLPIETQTTLVDGTLVDGPDSLRDALLERTEAFVTTATERLLTYALGRRLEYFDMPTVRGIVREASVSDYQLSELIVAVAQSEPFRTQVKEEAN